jgi:hypothetical protein
MKKCSPSLAIKEMKIKTTLRFLFTPVRIAIIKTQPPIGIGKDVEKKEPSYTAGMQASPAALENIKRLLKNLNIDLPYDPVIPLLVIYSKECDDSGSSRGTFTSMFIAVLFTIAKLWKQPRCPTTDE